MSQRYSIWEADRLRQCNFWADQDPTVLLEWHYPTIPEQKLKVLALNYGSSTSQVATSKISHTILVFLPGILATFVSTPFPRALTTEQGYESHGDRKAPELAHLNSGPIFRSSKSSLDDGRFTSWKGTRGCLRIWLGWEEGTLLWRWTPDWQRVAVEQGREIDGKVDVLGRGVRPLHAPN